MRQAIVVSMALVVLLAVSASAASTSPLKDYFGFFDINKDGRLSDVEITEGVWALENEEPGQLPPQELLELSRHIIIKEIDMNFDGFIDWSEYSLRFDRLNDHDAPEQIHLSLGNTTSAMTVTWVTKYVDNGAIAEFWPCGQSSNVQNLTAVTFTYEAGVFGWTGWIHRTQFQKLSAESCYTYRVGSQTSGKPWSPEFSFYTPPVTGTTPAGRPLSIALFGDMGTVMPLGFLVTDQMVADAAKQPQGSFDLFMHAGDISYAGTSASREFEEVWDLWSNQVQPLASVTPYMTAVGNHEKYYNFTSYLSRLDMPFGPTAQRNFYYSYDYGLVHFVSICTETYIYDYAPGTPQYLWIQQDLIKANKNRHNVPWIIVVGHRPMYSSDLSTDSGPLQQYLEPLLYQYQVDIALWGHMHEYERTYPVWNNTVTQYPVGKSVDGLPIFENAPSTIHLTIGTAGAFIFEHFQDPSPSWSAFHAEKYGYGHLQVFNATTLSFGFQSEREKAQVDGFWLQKDPSRPLSRVH